MPCRTLGRPFRHGPFQSTGLLDSLEGFDSMEGKSLQQRRKQARNFIYHFLVYRTVSPDYRIN